MKNKTIILLIAIILLSFFLRFYKIDFLNLWYDEVDTIYRSKEFFNYIPDYISYKDGTYNNISSPTYNEYDYKGLVTNFPLYYLLMNIWTNLFGTSESALRSLSALFSFFSVIFVFFLARLLFNDYIALISSFITAINPYNIAFSQEARTFSLMLFLSLLSSYFFIRFLNSQNTKKKNINIFFYIISSILLLYDHIIGSFILVAHFIFIFFSFLFYKKYKKYIFRYILSLVIIIIFFLPWLPHFYYISKWTNEFYWVDKFNLKDVPLTFIVFGIGQTLIRKISYPSTILAVSFFYFIGFLVPFLIAVSNLRKIRKNCCSNIFLLLCLFIPIVLLTLKSLISKPVFQWQYLLICTPYFFILIAYGIASIKKKIIISLLFIIILILSGISLYNYYSKPIFKGDWKAAAYLIEKNSKPGDIILIHSPQVINNFKYYYNGDIPIIGFPNPVYLTRENVYVTDENLKTINKIASQYKRIWLIQRLVKDKEETIPDYLDKKYKRLYFNKFVWIRVYLYQLK